VPFADANCFKIPEAVKDEQALFLSDAAGTGYMGADFCDIRPGDTVAVWGCGGVGLAQRSAQLMGAERVVAIDRIPERLALARDRLRSTGSATCPGCSSTPRRANSTRASSSPTGCP
jgi:threonine dehydrogenase-like Zn-dependent dehydrogenase